jgi:nitrite reductase/ring-hydroxylating ferredoxin subunit
MRRSQLLTINVLCPHFERPVSAQRNEATGRFVDCAAKAECVKVEEGTTVVVYPVGCPVFPARG